MGSISIKLNMDLFIYHSVWFKTQIDDHERIFYVLVGIGTLM